MKKKDSFKRHFLSVLSFMVSVHMLMAQVSVEVKGKVIDNQNEPMIGVSVLEKGTTNGTITDINGNYNLSVNQGTTLVFSYIGYITKEQTVRGNTLDLIMDEDMQALDEVIVIGYGVQRKSSLTGAVSSVKSEDLEARTITRPEMALQGKTSGVQVLSSSARPGANPSVRIRGISSNSSSDPLYVVDGRISADIGGIDPNDIESMEVLKDGASAAIYGAAAGNGVVLITTKRGKGT